MSGYAENNTNDGLAEHSQRGPATAISSLQRNLGRYFVLPNAMTVAALFFILLLLARVENRLHINLPSFEADESSFIITQASFLLIFAGLSFVPIALRSARMVWALIVIILFLLIFWRPGLPHFINQMFLHSRIGGGVEVRLFVRSEASCAVAPLDGLQQQCLDENTRSKSLPVHAWLVFQTPERLYIRFRPLEADDRKAVLVLNRASVDRMEYIEAAKRK